MAESVSTGGLKSFGYTKGHQPRMNKEEKYEIKQAYNEYYDRRKREKRRKNWIILAIIILVILLVVLYFGLKG